MPRYIDAYAALKRFEEMHGNESDLLNCYNADWVVSFIETQPTADVQEVLRCKDCKFYKVFSGIGHCGVLGICEPDDFCCRGERRKDNVEIHGVEH